MDKIVPDATVRLETKTEEGWRWSTLRNERVYWPWSWISASFFWVCLFNLQWKNLSYCRKTPKNKTPALMKSFTSLQQRNVHEKKRLTFNNASDEKQPKQFCAISSPEEGENIEEKIHECLMQLDKVSMTYTCKTYPWYQWQCGIFIYHWTTILYDKLEMVIFSALNAM